MADGTDGGAVMKITIIVEGKTAVSEEISEISPGRADAQAGHIHL